MRECGNEPGFHMYKYNLITKHNAYIESFYDFSDIINDILNINYNINISYVEELQDNFYAKDINRDCIKFDSNGYPFSRIENFEKPKNRETALEILNNHASNWIFSPELIKYYENDKELANIAVSRDKRAFTLISNGLQKDPDLIRLILNFEFCLEYNLKPEEYLSDEEEVRKLLFKNPKIIKFLSEKYRSDK